MGKLQLSLLFLFLRVDYLVAASAISYSDCVKNVTRYFTSLRSSELTSEFL